MANNPFCSHASGIEGQIDWAEGTFSTTAGSGTLDGKIWGQTKLGAGTVETAVDPASATGRRMLHCQAVGASAQAAVELRLRHMEHGEPSSPGFGGDFEAKTGRVLLHFWFDVSDDLTGLERMRFFQAENDSTNIFNIQVRKGTGAGELRLQSFVDGTNYPANTSGGDEDNTYGPSTFQNFLGQHCTALIDYRASTGASDGLVRVYIATGRRYTSADVLANGTNMFEVAHDETAAFERFNFGQFHITGYSHTSDLYHEWCAWKTSRDIEDFPDVEVIRDPLVGLNGDVTKNAFGVLCRAPGGQYKQDWHTDGAIRFSVRYWPIDDVEANATETAKVALTAANRWGACTTITGLAESAEYEYRIRLYDTSNDADFVDANHTVRVKLGGPNETIGQAHCLTSSGAGHPYELFDRLIEQGVRHCIVIDDVGYFDGYIGDDGFAVTTDEFLETALHTRLDGPMIRFGRQGSLIFKAGDHQYIDNWQASYKTDATTAINGRTGQSYGISYADVYTNAHAAWGLWAGDAMLGKLTAGEYYRALDWGGILIVIPDDVTFRDASANTLIGSTQKTALKAAWDSTSAKLIIFTPVRWNGPDGAIFGDNWQTSDYRAERQELEQDWLTDAPNAKVYIASGDRHFVEANTAFANGDYNRTAAASTVLLEATIGPGSARQWPDLPSENGAIKTVFEDVVGTGGQEWSRRYGIIEVTNSALRVEAFTAEDGVSVGSTTASLASGSAVQLSYGKLSGIIGQPLRGRL